MRSEVLDFVNVLVSIQVFFFYAKLIYHPPSLQISLVLNSFANDATTIFMGLESFVEEVVYELLNSKGNHFCTMLSIISLRLSNFKNILPTLFTKFSKLLKH